MSNIKLDALPLMITSPFEESQLGIGGDVDFHFSHNYVSWTGYFLMCLSPGSSIFLYSFF